MYRGWSEGAKQTLPLTPHGGARPWIVDLHMTRKTDRTAGTSISRFVTATRSYSGSSNAVSADVIARIESSPSSSSYMPSIQVGSGGLA